MRFKVVLSPSDEGIGVSVSGLPGCWSRGTIREEALENIAVAIQEYLESKIEPAGERRFARLRSPFRDAECRASIVSTRYG